MTTYTWPTGDTAFIPRAITVTFVNSQLINTSPLNGATQSVGLPGGRLKVRLDFPRHTYAERARLEAFFRRLNGMQHRVSLWDLARAVPQGNWNTGGVTTGAAAAQFASSLTLAGCYGRNLVRYSGTIAGTGWSNNGTPTVTTTTGPFGSTTAADIACTVNNTGRYASINGLTVGQAYRFSLYLKSIVNATIVRVGNDASGVAGATSFNLVTGAVNSNGAAVASSGIAAVGGGWYRAGVTHVAVTTSMSFIIYGQASQEFAADAAQLEVGTQSTDYARWAEATAGDWLQVPTSTGNQLVQVVAPATADDAGAMTVEVQPMLRGSVASGAAVVLDKPSALFVLPDMEFSVPRGGSGICPEFSVDLYEVFA